MGKASSVVLAHDRRWSPNGQSTPQDFTAFFFAPNQMPPRIVDAIVCMRNWWHDHPRQALKRNWISYILINTNTVNIFIEFHDYNQAFTQNSIWFFAFYILLFYYIFFHVRLFALFNDFENIIKALVANGDTTILFQFFNVCALRGVCAQRKTRTRNVINSNTDVNAKNGNPKYECTININHLADSDCECTCVLRKRSLFNGPAIFTWNFSFCHRCLRSGDVTLWVL